MAATASDGLSERVGAWLFARRGWLPVPVVLIGLWLPTAPVLPGLVVLAAGEAVRLWAVGHIGLPSRTREASVGALVDTGPYGLVRNPLYVGNILLWTGFGLLQRPAAAVILPLFLVYYGLIVRWEERRLAAAHGAAWVEYAARVGRWLPRGLPRAWGGWDARKALRTERGTLLVLAVVLAAVAVRRTYA